VNVTNVTEIGPLALFCALSESCNFVIASQILGEAVPEVMSIFPYSSFSIHKSSNWLVILPDSALSSSKTGVAGIKQYCQCKRRDQKRERVNERKFSGP